MNGSCAMGRFFKSLRGAGSLLYAGLILVSGSQSHAANSERDYFFDGSRVESLDVYLDRVAVLVPMRENPGKIASTAAGFGLDVDSLYPKGLTVLTLQKGPTTRSEVLAKARSLRDSLGGFFLRAGLVVSAPRVYSPMLLPDEVIVQRRPPRGRGSSPRSPGDRLLDSLVAAYGATILDQNPDRRGQFLVSLPRSTPFDAITASRRLAKLTAVQYAVPNFYHVIRPTQGGSGEPMFPRQWHLGTAGPPLAAADADIDAVEAWSLSSGDGVLVAVIDGGFDIDHEDLAGNLWVNDDPCDASHTDDDKNGYKNDTHGWDFYGCFAGCGTSWEEERCYPCGYRDPSGDCKGEQDRKACGDLALTCVKWVPDDFHGTAVAGIIGAVGDNNLGGSGVAPNAKLMLIRASIDEYLIGKMFDYARANGAWVINCSWRLLPDQVLTKVVRRAIVDASEDGRGGKGCVIVFAMTNESRNDCTGARAHDEILMLQRTSDGKDAVIAVSGSDSDARKAANTGYGDCMDLVAPTSGGTVRIATADQSGSVGYNSNHRSWIDPDSPHTLEESPSDGYTYLFTGTSAATPMVSGAAALVLAANPGLTAPEVQRLLQDTADKIDDLSAKYDDASGFSRGDASRSASVFGWGRVNAFEAVRIVAPASAGGLDGADLFVRDDRLDWGNTERPLSADSAVPSSLDIKVDAGPSFAERAPGSSAEFDAFADETPAPGQENRLYVRVRNRGVATIENPRAHVAIAYLNSGTLPPLPEDFWSNFSDDSWTVGDWQVAGKGEGAGIAYSGASASRDAAGDPAAIIEVTCPKLPVPPTGYAGKGVFLVIVDSDDDPPSALIRAREEDSYPTSDLDPLTQIRQDNNVAAKSF